MDGPGQRELASVPAWRDADLSDPHTAADKASRVRRMFAAIAPSYDLNNRLHSFGRDQAWRRAAVKMAGLKPTDRVVDVACGTGDLTLAFLKALLRLNDHSGLSVRLRSNGFTPVTGIDYTPAMLAIAQAKTHRIRASGTGPGGEWWTGYCTPAIWMSADAMHLPLPDASCDVVSIAFGIRNVADPRKAMAEFFRVLRPGGRVIMLEFSTPTNPVIRRLHDLYCQRIMPVTATWIARDKSGAYKYLPRSVETFATRDQMTRMLQSAGFADVTLKPMTFGVAVVYRGVKHG